MRTIRTDLEKLRTIKKKIYHPLIHDIHKKHKISKKTLFYVKEYGPHANVPRTIIRESIKILLFASIISSVGGLALENIKTLFISIMPLVIMITTLNGLIGNCGTIVSSRFSTMLHENGAGKNWWANKELRRLFTQVFIVSLLTAFSSSAIALVISAFSGYNMGAGIVYKIFLISMIDVVLLVTILFSVVVTAGVYLYKKKEDPNNFLIPITTSIADFGNMIILSVLVILLF